MDVQTPTPTHETPPTAPAADTAARWFTGRVVDVAPEAIYVSVQQRVREAQVALACLVAPGLGDEVGLLRTADERWFVMSVLVRPGHQDVVLQAPGGLTLSAAGAVGIETPEALRLKADALEGDFQRVRLTTRLAQVTGVELVLNSRVAKLVAHAAEACLSRLSLNTQRSYRHVAEAEHVRAGVLDIRAKHLASVRAGTTVLSSRELTKVDGTQIHVG
jgi:predicted thioesterase